MDEPKGHTTKLGKVEGLYFLVSIGYNVPEFKVIHGKKIALTDIENQSLLKSSLTRKEKLIIEGLVKLNWGKIAVRSSAVDEDQASISAAGQYETYLDVSCDEESIRQSIRKCQASAFSRKILKYRALHNISAPQYLPNVILQKMLYPVVSGVIFTEHPTLGVDYILIELTDHSLSELCSGNLTPKRVIVDKNTNTIVQKDLDELPNSFKEKFTEVISEFGTLSTLLEDRFKQGVELEWGFVETGEIFYFQLRNITTKINAFDSEMMYLKGDYKYLYSFQNTRPYTFPAKQGPRLLDLIERYNHGSKMVLMINSNWTSNALYDSHDLELAKEYYKAFFIGTIENNELIRAIAKFVRKLKSFVLHEKESLTDLSNLESSKLKEKLILADRYRDLTFETMEITWGEYSVCLEDRLKELLTKYGFNWRDHYTSALYFHGILPWDLEDEEIISYAKLWPKISNERKNFILNKLANDYGWIGKVEGSSEYDVSFYLQKILDATKTPDLKKKQNSAKSAAYRNLPLEVRNVARMISYFGYLRLKLKYYHMLNQYIISSYVDELVCRTNERVLYLATVDEIINKLSGKVLDINELMLRQLGCAAYYNNGKLKFLTGDSVAILKQLVLPVSSSLSSVVGQPGYPGYVIGKASLINFDTNNWASDVDAFEKGTILVTGNTRPHIIHLCRRASGLVTDEGGITCHAAVISREFQMPSVIGTHIATKIINTNDLLEINAYKGEVIIYRPLNIANLYQENHEVFRCTGKQYLEVMSLIINFIYSEKQLIKCSTYSKIIVLFIKYLASYGISSNCFHGAVFFDKKFNKHKKIKWDTKLPSTIYLMLPVLLIIISNNQKNFTISISNDNGCIEQVKYFLSLLNIEISSQENYKDFTSFNCVAFELVKVISVDNRKYRDILVCSILVFSLLTNQPVSVNFKHPIKTNLFFINLIKMLNEFNSNLVFDLILDSTQCITRVFSSD